MKTLHINMLYIIAVILGFSSCTGSGNQGSNYKILESEIILLDESGVKFQYLYIKLKNTGNTILNGCLEYKITRENKTNESVAVYVDNINPNEVYENKVLVDEGLAGQSKVISFELIE